MKMIKRTTIRIRQRELIVAQNNAQSGAEAVHLCPNCNFPMTSQRSLESEERNSIKQLPAANEILTK